MSITGGQSNMSKAVPCKVYRCERKQGAYLYLGDDTDIGALPDAVTQSLQPFVEVMALSLTVDSKLANANAKTVIDDLDRQGFYLQLPPALMRRSNTVGD